VTEHAEILALIEAGDADGAAEAMRVHVQHTAELLIAQEAGAGTGVLDIDLGWTNPA
jgi:DNA-binding GntR family transcriptional regulator